MYHVYNILYIYVSRISHISGQVPSLRFGHTAALASSLRPHALAA